MANLLDGAVEIKKKTRWITQQRLRNILFSIRGAKMCTIICETTPRMRKTNNPYFGQIVKRCRMNVTIGFIYANSVNNQRGREGSAKDFVPEPRKWGQRLEGTCLVTHNNNMYLEYKPNASPQFVEYYHNGEPIAKEELTEWLQVPNSNAEHQGVDKEIILRDVLCDNITDLIYGGVHLRVRR